MSYNGIHTGTIWSLHGGQLVNISASPSTSFVPVPYQGTLRTAWIAISAAITVANAVITIKKNSTTIGTITVVQAGSAAGSTFEAVMTGSEADRTFAAGDTLSFASDGGSTTTSIGTFQAVFKGM